jgi:tRNA pseudouridine38-40 synthase
MLRYLLRITYDGSKYYGFQRLKKNPSVQKELEEALSKVFKENIEIKGSGRTDKGVHAIDQCVSFDAPFEIDSVSLIKAVNRRLSNNVYVKAAKRVSSDFHARFSVKKKGYEYKINVGEYSPLLNDYYYQPREKINLKRLRKAARLFIGTHDYKNFVSGEHENTISNIYKITINKKNNIIIIKIIGTKFYKYMVRNIVGALLDYNKEKVDLDSIKSMLDNPQNKVQLTTICPNGLYLTKIIY